jgi:hypothetical protein
MAPEGLEKLIRVWDYLWVSQAPEQALRLVGLLILENL